jgi:hypothetical protein
MRTQADFRAAWAQSALFVIAPITILRCGIEQIAISGCFAMLCTTI